MATDTLGGVHLEIADDAGLLLCSHPECGFALSPKAAQVNDHLRKRHSIPSGKRQEISRILRALRGLKDPVSAEPREDGVDRDPSLLCVDGFLCRWCSFRTIHRATALRHVSSAHPVNRCTGVVSTRRYRCSLG